MRLTHFIAYCMLLFAVTDMLYSQTPGQNATPPTISSVSLSSPNRIRLSLKNIPELPLKVGNSVPKWTYFWEFGDGTYEATESSSVTHNYPASSTSQSYKTRVTLSPHYVPPDVLPQVAKGSVSVSSFPSGSYTKAFPETTLKNSTIDLVVNQEPVPGHIVRFGMLYEYPEQYGKAGEPIDGLLLLYYNHRELPGEVYLFENLETQINDKSVTPTSLSRVNEKDPFYRDYIREQYAKNYRSVKVWNLKDLKPKELNSLFFTLKTLVNPNQKAKDVGKPAPIAAVLWPNGMSLSNTPISAYETYGQELSLTIKSSLDPNKINVNTIELFTNPAERTLHYKIMFENKGNEPARRVKIAMENPAYLNDKTYETKEMSPECPPCADVDFKEPCLEVKLEQDSIYWVFHNVEIRGKKEEGLEKDAEIGGWVEFEIETDTTILGLLATKELKKISLQAVITFDTWKILKTNKAKTFLKAKNTHLTIGTRPGFWLESMFNQSVNGKDALRNLSFSIDRTIFESRYFYTKIGGGISNQVFEPDPSKGWPLLKSQFTTLDASLSAHHALFRGFNFGAGPTASLLLNVQNVIEKEQVYNVFNNRAFEYNPMAYGLFLESNLNLRYLIFVPLHLKLRFDAKQFKINDQPLWANYFTLGVNIGIPNGKPEYLRNQEKLEKKSSKKKKK